MIVTNNPDMESLEYVYGHLAGLANAVTALIETHPDKQLFLEFLHAAYAGSMNNLSSGVSPERLRGLDEATNLARQVATREK